MNKITIIGNLVKDPETRTTPSGVTVCTFVVATNRRFANADGERQSDFFRIQAWRQLGETCARYLGKGRKVAVWGELQARLYENRDGKTQMSLDVVADEVEFLTPAENTETKPAKKAKENSDGYDATPADAFTDIRSDVLPWEK